MFLLRIGILLLSIYTGILYGSQSLVCTSLLRRMSHIVWSTVSESFYNLNKASVLFFPNFTKCFIVETDVSGLGLRAVLSQKQLGGKKAPITYASWTLQKHEKNYSISELEVLAVAWAAKISECTFMAIPLMWLLIMRLYRHFRMHLILLANLPEGVLHYRRWTSRSTIGLIGWIVMQMPYLVLCWMSRGL